MVRNEQKSAILAHCIRCCGIYEVEGLQSHRICENCNPPKRCAHGVKITVPCKACIRVHGARLGLRVM